MDSHAGTYDWRNPRARLVNLLRQRGQRSCLSTALAENLLDFARRRVERFAAAHFADQRLIEPQAQHLFDLSAFRVAELLLRKFLRFHISPHPADARLLRTTRREHV